MKSFTRASIEPKEIKIMNKYICECSPNAVFKSATGICGKCGAECQMAQEFKQAEADKLKLSPKFMKPTERKPSSSVKAYTERDMREIAKAKAKKR